MDAAAVADSLIGIHEGKASEAVLEKYAEVRRNIFVDTVNPTSQANKTRLHDSDADTIGDRDPFLRMLRTATKEEKQQQSLHFQLAQKWGTLRSRFNAQSMHRHGAERSDAAGSQ